MNNPLTLYKYKVYCDTETAERYWWLDENQTVPTSCPNDTSHSIDGTQTQVIDTRLAEQLVVINQEPNGQTGGHYRFHTINFEILPTTSESYAFSFPFAISIMSATMTLRPQNALDIISVRASPDTTVGTLLSDVFASSNTVHVSNTAISAFKIGYTLSLSDGTNTDDMGYVIDIDPDTNIITTEINTTHSFLSSAPTSIIMNVWMLKNVVLGYMNEIQYMRANINGTYVPANTDVLCEYTNISNQLKHFVVSMEFMY